MDKATDRVVFDFDGTLVRRNQERTQNARIPRSAGVLEQTADGQALHARRVAPRVRQRRGSDDF